VEIITALRRDDKVTLDECRRAMLEEGASRLFGANNPQLRFATLEQAESARKRLIQKLPTSEQVWLITQDVDPVSDWSGRVEDR
jgi:hypothetical protein